ncbi:hypothetical protein PUN28_000683 [Cardiocondyla obscurior]|uniref:Uncharacterized protein n=1 Tax=Cardiocondyla obscurior TaxID=286306 RepID=A0AAW2H0I6_9HYME
MARGVRSQKTSPLSIFSRVAVTRDPVSQKFSQGKPVGDIDWRATRRAGPSIGRLDSDGCSDIWTGGRVNGTESERKTRKKESDGRRETSSGRRREKESVGVLTISFIFRAGFCRRSKITRRRRHIRIEGRG